MANPARNLLSKQRGSIFAIGRRFALFGACFIFLLFCLFFVLVFSRAQSPTLSFLRPASRVANLAPQDTTFLLHLDVHLAQLSKLKRSCEIFARQRQAPTTKCSLENFFSFPAALGQDLNLQKVQEITKLSFPLAGQKSGEAIILRYAFGPERLLARLRQKGGKTLDWRQGYPLVQLGSGERQVFYTSFDDFLVFSPQKESLERILSLQQGREASLARLPLFQKLQTRVGLRAPFYLYRNQKQDLPSFVTLDSKKGNRLLVKAYFLQDGPAQAEQDPSWLRFIPAQTVAVLHCRGAAKAGHYGRPLSPFYILLICKKRCGNTIYLK